MGSTFKDKLDIEAIDRETKTITPIVGGAIVFILSLSVIAFSSYFLMIDEFSWLEAYRQLYIVAPIIAPCGLIAGALAIMRRRYRLTVALSLIALISSSLAFWAFGFSIATVGITLITLASGEFAVSKRAKTDEEFEG